MKNTFSLLALILLSACNQPQQAESLQKQVKAETSHNITGLWLGVLQSPGGELPFGIDIAANNGIYSAKIINGEERVDTSKVTLNNNQLTIEFSWFDARIQATLSKDGQNLTGNWSKTASGKDQQSSLPFVATRDYSQRFIQESNPEDPTSVAGNWEVTFSDEDGESIAVAEFSQAGNIVNGTFLTPTGDYRFLSGVANQGKLLVQRQLSCHMECG